MRKRTRFIHEGKYVAEVDVELIDADDEWAPDADQISCQRYKWQGRDRMAAYLASNFGLTNRFGWRV